MGSWFETLIRSKRARLAFAATLAATALWSFAPYVVSEIGSQAYVNAPLVRLTAPIAGTVAELPEAGRYLDTARTLRLVGASAGARGRVGELQEARDVAAASTALADRQLGELARERARLGERLAAFGGASRARAAAQLGEARGSRAACDAEAGESLATLARVRALAARGFAASATVDRAAAAAATWAGTCRARAAQVAVRVAEADAAARGVFLADGASDTPYAVQQRDRLLLRAQELEGVRVAAAARLVELDAQLREARAATRADASLPGGHVVWSRAASTGSVVAAGAPLLDLADCTRRFVAVTLPERRIESLRGGQIVAVRLIGADDWQAGRVVGVSGAAARRGTALDAAGETDRDARALTVEVALAAAPPASHLRRCDIGRLAEVRFARHWL